MSDETSDFQVWIGAEGSDGLMYSATEMLENSELASSCGFPGIPEGSVVFSDLYETVVASGMFYPLGQEILVDAVHKLRAGETVLHAAFQDDSPVELRSQDGQLIVTDMDDETSVKAPLEAALDQMELARQAFEAFSALPDAR